jgi:hypothetical protein
MIGSIFYAFGLIILISLISSLVKFKKNQQVFEWYSKYEKITGISPNESDFRSKGEWSQFQSSKIISLFEFLWFVFGLISKSWMIFATILLISFLISISIKSIEFTIFAKTIKWLSLLIKIVTVFTLTINHFHLHLNLQDMLIGSIFGKSF